MNEDRPDTFGMPTSRESGWLVIVQIQKDVENLKIIMHELMQAVHANEERAHKERKEIREGLQKLDKIVPNDLDDQLKALNSAYDRVKGAMGILMFLGSGLIIGLGFARDWIVAQFHGH